MGRPGGETGASPAERVDTHDSLRLLVESVKDYAIFLLDPAGIVTTWNAGARRLKGYTAEEIIGRHFSTFYTAEDVASGTPERLLRRALEDGRVEAEGWRVRKDGTLFWADVVITAVFDEQGRHLGFAKVTRDLTERQQAERERLRLAHAEEAVRLREEFMSIAAHELRTPLNALQLQIATLEMLLADPEKHPEIDRRDLATKVRRLLRSTGRLGELVSRLLDVSRLIRGGMHLEKRETDLVDCAQEVLHALRERSAADHARIQLRAPEHAVGDWDLLRVEQLVSNLVENAIRYGEGSPIEVSIEVDELTATFRVADRGPGIPEEERERIFERFTAGRQKKRGSHGLGLGLYITRMIAEAHGGRIELKDSGGIGACFEVRLPRTMPASALEAKRAG